MPSSLEEITWSFAGKLTILDMFHPRKPMISFDKSRHILGMGLPLLLPVGCQPSTTIWELMECLLD